MLRNKMSVIQEKEDIPSDKRVKIVDVQRLIKLKSGQVVRSPVNCECDSVIIWQLEQGGGSWQPRQVSEENIQ